MHCAAILTAVALLAEAAPSQTPPAPEVAPAQHTEGALSVAILEREAVVAKRRRRWRGSLGVGLGGLTVGLGIYGLASPRFDRVMKRSAFAQLFLGASTVGLGIYALAWPRPVEQLRASDAYAALAADPDDPAAMRRLRMRWAARARRAQTMRYVMGGGYIAGGLGLTALGTISHFYAAEQRSDVETLWSFTTIGTGIGLVLTGALRTTIHSQVERTYEAFACVYGWPSYRTSHKPPRGARVQVAPLVGGVQIMGAF